MVKIGSDKKVFVSETAKFSYSIIYSIEQQERIALSLFCSDYVTAAV